MTVTLVAAADRSAASYRTQRETDSHGRARTSSAVRRAARRTDAKSLTPSPSTGSPCASSSGDPHRRAVGHRVREERRARSRRGAGWEQRASLPQRSRCARSRAPGVQGGSRGAQRPRKPPISICPIFPRNASPGLDRGQGLCSLGPFRAFRGPVGSEPGPWPRGVVDGSRLRHLTQEWLPTSDGPEARGRRVATGTASAASNRRPSADHRFPDELLQELVGDFTGTRLG
jgi:hypothetical protein